MNKSQKDNIKFLSENEMEFIKNSIREWELKNSRNAELSKNRTAVLLKENLENYAGRANLYELYPPLQIPNGNYNPETDSENKEEKVIMHVIVSGIDKSTFLEFRERKNIPDILPSNFEYPIETFIFESDSKGNVENWSELRGSFKGELNHIRALNNLGYNNIIKLDEL
jgi:hypothetical protein